jgi:hypothetical protein
MDWRLESARFFCWRPRHGLSIAAIENAIVGGNFEGFRVGWGERDIGKPKSLVAVARVVALYLHVDT